MRFSARRRTATASSNWSPPFFANEREDRTRLPFSAWSKRGLQVVDGGTTCRVLALMLVSCGGPDVRELPVSSNQHEAAQETRQSISLDGILGAEVLTATKAATAAVLILALLKWPWCDCAGWANSSRSASWFRCSVRRAAVSRVAVNAGTRINTTPPDSVKKMT